MGAHTEMGWALIRALAMIGMGVGTLVFVGVAFGALAAGLVKRLMR